MAREGIPFIVLFLVPSLILVAIGFWVGAAACLLLAGFMAFFFRDPERQCPSDDGVVVSPADGRVLVIARLDPGARMGPGAAESPTQISIFLSPLDVHVNRSPIAGEVVDVAYRQGAFHFASRAIASVENEQNIVTVRGPLMTITFRQIAGILARRLVLWLKPGDHVDLGERVGLMKFSSRMDVLMPPEVEVLVRRGQHVRAGVSVIGRVRATPRPAGESDD